MDICMCLWMGGRCMIVMVCLTTHQWLCPSKHHDYYCYTVVMLLYDQNYQLYQFTVTEHTNKFQIIAIQSWPYCNSGCERSNFHWLLFADNVYTGHGLKFLRMDHRSMCWRLRRWNRFLVSIERISVRLFIHSKTLILEWGMKWMSRMCVSWMRYIFLLKDASGTTFISKENLYDYRGDSIEVFLECRKTLEHWGYGFDSRSENSGILLCQFAQ